MEKYIRLNRSSTDSTTEGYLMLQISNFTGSHPSADNRWLVYFLPMTENQDPKGVDNFEVAISITNNKHKDDVQSLTVDIDTGENI